MFEATIKNGRLEQFINTADAAVEETKIHIEDDKLWMRAVDTANVLMFHSEIDAAAFEHYDVDADNIEYTTLGINVERMLDVLSLGDDDDTVELQLDTDASYRLTVSVDNFEYTLSLIDPDTIRGEPDIPDLDLPVTANVPWQYIDQGTRAADMVSDHLRVVSNENEETLAITASGDTDDTTTTLTDDELNSIDAAGEADSLFSVGYMKNIGKGVPGDVTPVHVEIGTELPIVIRFNHSDDAISWTEYTLAPRLQSN